MVTDVSVLVIKRSLLGLLLVVGLAPASLVISNNTGPEPVMRIYLIAIWMCHM